MPNWPLRGCTLAPVGTTTDISIHILPSETRPSSVFLLERRLFRATLVAAEAVIIGLAE